MKTTILLTILFCIGVCLGSDFSIINQGVKINVYSQLQTNWFYHTNTFEAYYQWDNETNNSGPHVYTFFDNNSIMLVGVITSNNICDIFYNNQLKGTTTLSSNKLGRLEIKSSTQTVYTTNYMTGKHSRLQ